MIEIVELNTNRLHLRQWRDSDKGPFAMLKADPEVMKFFPSLLDRSASDAMADRCGMLIAKQGWGFWAVEIIENKKFIGFVGLRQAHDQLPFAPCVEIGWRIAKEFWGKGYATEAASAALNFGFNQLHLNEIVSFTSMRNLPSQAVMHRLGMQRSLPNFAHPTLPIDHPLSEHCLYRITSEQWQQR